MVYPNQDIEDILRQLNQPSGGSKFSLSGGGLSGSTQKFSLSGSNLTDVPRNLEPFMQATPAAITNRDTGNFWVQFGKGVLSPITDTLAGIGVIKPRELPTGVAGILGNMAGSVVGWSALTGLVTLFTGGTGTAGVAAAGAAKVGLATKIGMGALKGATIGGLSQAHTFAFGQQDYGAIPREFLTGALFGGVFGGAFGAVGHHLQKTGKLIDDPRGLMGSIVTNRNINNIITTDDAPSLIKAIRTTRGEEGVILRGLLNNSFLDDSAMNAIKTTTGNIRKTPGISKKLVSLLDELDGVTNYGGVDDTLKKVHRYVRDLLPANTKFNDLNYGAQQTYNKAFMLEQDLMSSAKGYITRLLDPDMGLVLPSLRQIQSPKLAKGQLKMIQTLAKDDNGLTGYLDFDGAPRDFLRRVAKETGTVYNPNASNYRSSDFLVGKAERFRPEWEKLVKNIKPTDISVVRTGATAVTINSPIKDGDINSLFKAMKNLPKDITHGISIADERILKSNIGWLTAKLAPIRSITGESQFRMLRSAGQKMSADLYDKQTGYITNLTKIGQKYGWTSDKIRKQHGGAIGDIIERALPDNAPIMGLYKGNSAKIAKLLTTNSNDSTAIKELQKVFKLNKKELDFVTENFSKIIHKEGNIEGLKKIAGKIGRDYDDLVGDLLSDFIHNTRLGRVKSAANNKLRFESLMKELGVKDKKHLLAAAEGRAYFDDLFIKSGIDPSMYRAAYLPRYRKLDGSDWKVALKEFKDIGVPDKAIDRIFWANELQRDGTLVAYNNNFFEAAERYVRGMTKKKHYEPAFEAVNEVFKSVNIHHSRAQVYHNVQRSIMGVPSEMQQGFDTAFANFAHFLGTDATPQTSKMIGSMLAELQYASGMGFNPFMPIRNLAQKALALSSITDSGNPIEGLGWMTKAKLSKAAKSSDAAKWIELNDILAHRVYTEALDIQGGGWVRLAKIFGASDATVGRMDDVMQNWAMRMFRWSDRSNVEDVFMARAMYLQSKGFSVADTVEMARATTMATQFMYGLDSPMLYKTPLGKQIGIFQSWPLNWAQMLWDQGTQGNMKRAVSTIATMAVASEMLSMTGMSFRSIHPTETVRGILPVAMLEGEQSWPLAFRVGSVVFDYMRALSNGDESAIDAAMNNFARNAEGLVPFGVVTSRTLKFIDRARHDWRDYADTGFMHTSALKLNTREDTSRLVRILDEDPNLAQLEAARAWLGTTTKAVQRQQDAEFIQGLQESYKRTRRMAIQAFIDEDYANFQRLQEQLVFNFGKWIEPKDIRQELMLMGMTARERQVYGLPKHIQDAFFETILDPRSPSSIR